MKNKVLNKISVVCKLNADYLTVTITNKDTGCVLQELIPLEFPVDTGKANEDKVELVVKTDSELDNTEEDQEQNLSVDSAETDPTPKAEDKEDIK